ncbi:hypothetical protein [Arthrobacter sp. 24S4-2]|uniref:hypothetical protein n=1 Tax=Arthrobacter sp. 24S4-2 TaxID=2575374 RepID=UPI0015864FC9|nr:hypothetical protein [Arthrobacter sp. 24S4-2]
MIGGCTPPVGDIIGHRTVAQDPLPKSVSIQEVDGGRDFYSRFSPSLPNGDGYFPVGVWFESVTQPSDVDQDRAAGINTYIQLTANSDLSLIKASGLQALPSSPSPLASGYLLSDEVDMWAGGGSNKWTGKSQGEGVICDPPDSGCGFTVQEAMAGKLPANALTYANYGKGVTFHLKNPEAAQFVNSYQDVISADNYWFTDPYICSLVEGGAVFAGGRDLTDGECRIAAHYGWTVDRVRSLVQPARSKPVWAFVEVGHPFSEPGSLAITAPQIRAAVWSSIIHGARGVVYFNHNFGGECLSQHVLRDDCGAAVRPTVTALNQQIQRLAPVLNSPTVNGLVSADGRRVDVLVKAYQGQFYLMAAANSEANQSVTFSFACGSPVTAEVLDENRSVNVSANSFTDNFADSNAVHIYKFNSGNTCGLGLG